jgi:hypothetical protein
MKISYLLTNLIFFATWMSQTMFDVPETDTACNPVRVGWSKKKPFNHNSQLLLRRLFRGSKINY